MISSNPWLDMAIKTFILYILDLLLFKGAFFPMCVGIIIAVSKAAITFICMVVPACTAMPTLMAL